MDMARRRHHRGVLGAMLISILSLTTGCSTPNSQSANTTLDSSKSATNISFNKQILSDFADKVVIPTNQLFALKAKALSQAVDTLVKNPNDQNLQAAQKAWVAARSPWEQSECFGFGPVKSLGYDGALDTWPVNETDLKKILMSKDPITAEYIEKRQDTEKGFHVIEYLLFGEGKNRQIKQLKNRELDYLQALAHDFSRVANLLVDSWTKGVEGKPAYREIIATSGNNNNTIYPTVQTGGQEIVASMVDSLSEVATSKIGKAFTKQDSKLAESRFSLNTLTDLKHNVEGSQNVYLGHFPDGKTAGMGLTSYIAQVNPSLDNKVKKQFELALNSLNQVPEPFEKSVVEPKIATTIKAAAAAVSNLSDTLDKEVKPLIKS
jgi:predicted lipoprotein